MAPHRNRGSKHSTNPFENIDEGGKLVKKYENYIVTIRLDETPFIGNIYILTIAEFKQGKIHEIYAQRFPKDQIGKILENMERIYRLSRENLENWENFVSCYKGITDDCKDALILTLMGINDWAQNSQNPIATGVFEKNLQKTIIQGRIDKTIPFSEPIQPYMYGPHSQGLKQHLESMENRELLQSKKITFDERKSRKYHLHPYIAKLVHTIVETRIKTLDNFQQLGNAASLLRKRGPELEMFVTNNFQEYLDRRRPLLYISSELEHSIKENMNDWKYSIELGPLSIERETHKSLDVKNTDIYKFLEKIRKNLPNNNIFVSERSLQSSKYSEKFFKKTNRGRSYLYNHVNEVKKIWNNSDLNERVMFQDCIIKSIGKIVKYIPLTNHKVGKRKYIELMFTDTYDNSEYDSYIPLILDENQLRVHLDVLLNSVIEVFWIPCQIINNKLEMIPLAIVQLYN